MFPKRSPQNARAGFTLIEILVVIAIIAALAALTVAFSGSNVGAKRRATTEIAALSAACETYKADHGAYPRSEETDALSAVTDLNPTDPKYRAASLALYKALSGDLDGDGRPDMDRSTDQLKKSYYDFRFPMLGRADPQKDPSASNPVTYLRDPFGLPYGYSTASCVDAKNGFNPTFDLWSTAGTTNDRATWLDNWRN